MALCLSWAVALAALIPLARSGLQITGVDLSPEMLRIAEAKARAARVSGSVELIRGDYADAPWPAPTASFSSS